MGEALAAASLDTVDWVVVAAYLAGLVALGLAVVRPQARPEEYFLASRRSTWPVIGLALIASNLSSTPLVGLAGAAYSIGISVYDYEWTAVVALAFFCVFLLPFILASRVYTMPEYLERRYDRRARLYFVMLSLVLLIAVDSAGVLYCGALLCRLVVPTLPLWPIILLLAGGGALYAVLGGLRAVMRTQAVQAVAMFTGALAVAVAAFVHAGGWEVVMHGVAPERLSLIRPADDPGLPWPGLVLGIPLLGFYYWCTNQAMVQRVLSARDLDHGRWGLLLAGLLKLPVLFLMVLPGTCAILIFPDLPRPDMVYPMLVFTLLPAGLKGLVAASFAAGTMAVTASTLNTAATLLTMDIVRPAFPGLEERRLVPAGRVATAACFLATILWAPQLENFRSLWQYGQAVLAYAVPPIVALFLIGLFWRGATAAGAAATLVAGTGCGFALFLANAVFRWTDFHFLYAAPLLVAIDSAILIVVSLCTAVPVEAEGLTWTPRHYGAETARLAVVAPWRNYRVLSAALLALTGAVVIAFR